MRPDGGRRSHGQPQTGGMLPLTVTSRSLLVNDSDSLFRELIQDLLTLAYQSQELRGASTYQV